MGPATSCVPQDRRPTCSSSRRTRGSPRRRARRSARAVARRLHRQPARQRGRREPAASGTQVGADRANALLLTDIAGGVVLRVGRPHARLQFRRRATRRSKRVYAHATTCVTFAVQAHYANPKASLPPTPTAGPRRRTPSRLSTRCRTSQPVPRPPRTASPSCPSRCGRARADPRVGHFVDEVWDFTDDARERHARNCVTRWRLEKKDPAAALSEPVKPIVYWIDRNVPEKYRDAVRDGILEWNKAFEKIGFKDAIRVEMQPDDAAWSTTDARHASVRWFVGTDTRLRHRPQPDRSAHRRDPRRRRRHSRCLGAAATAGSFARISAPQRLARVDAYKAALGLDPRACTYATDALAEMRIRARPARGARRHRRRRPRGRGVRAGEPQGRSTMHEVGHTLGLRHNFRSSTVYPLEKLADREFTATTVLPAR